MSRILLSSMFFAVVIAASPKLVSQAGLDTGRHSVGPAALPADSVPGAVPDGLSAPDWAGIHAAYEASRRAAFQAEGGYEARNPSQRWLTRFDGTGFAITPDSGGWTWGLVLIGYGAADGTLTRVDSPRVSVDGQRVTYAWDDIVQEWFINDARGLEHGFTVSRRPAMAAGEPMIIRMSVRGGMAASIDADRRGATFSGDDGAATLRYSGLVVSDAGGRLLDAWLEGAGDELMLAIEIGDARFPLTVDPIAQQAYLKASNTEASDIFGRSVSVSGNTVIVGATGEDSNATGVNGNQSNNTASNAGAAYVFVRQGSTWSQQAYLKASNTDAGDSFGKAVSISGDTAVVTAWLESSSATGVNGNQSDNSAPLSGAAYVFVRNGTTWSQQAYIKASNTESLDEFGFVADLSGDTLLVGSPQESSSATGINGNQTNNNASGSGAAYIFVRSGTTWSQQAYVKASNTGAADEFGIAVAVDDATAIVGAFDEDSNATGVNGNQSDNSELSAGAAYVFRRNGTTWSQEAYLKASNTEDHDLFGISVTVDHDANTAAVGATGEGSNATGLNGNQSDNSASGAGAAYVFIRNGTTWSQQAYVKASNTGSGDNFGGGVVSDGNTLVVSAFDEASNATGINGNQSDNSVFGAGAVYVFTRSGTTWTQLAYVKASNTDAGDGFNVVDAADDVLIVGASFEDSNATGVNGTQSNNSATSAGAAYVFDLDLDVWTDLGSGLAGEAGIPYLAGTGPLTTGSSGALTLVHAADSEECILYVALSSTPAAFKCGTLVPVPVDAQFTFTTSASGTVTVPWSSWPSGLSGQTIYYQFAIDDPAAICGVALSNAVSGEVP